MKCHLGSVSCLVPDLGRLKGQTTRTDTLLQRSFQKHWSFGDMGFDGSMLQNAMSTVRPGAPWAALQRISQPLREARGQAPCSTQLRPVQLQHWCACVAGASAQAPGPVTTSYGSYQGSTPLKLQHQRR